MRSVLFRLLSLVLRAFRSRPRGNGPQSILVLQYAMPLGCCVHGTPLFAALKAADPHRRILVATRSLGAATLQHDPNIDAIVETADPLPSLSAMWSVAQQLRRELRQRGEHPSLILQDASSRRGTYALFAALLRLAPTAGFADAPELYDHPLAYDPSLSLIDNNLRLAAIAGRPASHTEPAVYFTPAELARARVLLDAANPQGRPLTAFVLQGSGGQRTGWYDDRFAGVIRYMESLGHATVFLGTAADAPTIDRIRSAVGSQGASLAGQTSIAELAAVLCLCELAITLDTGTMHVGRASQTPMVVLGPSWQKPLEWLPLQVANVRILRGEDRSGVPADYRLDEIETAQVMAAANDLLQQYPPSSSARESRVTARLSETRS